MFLIKSKINIFIYWALFKFNILGCKDRED